MNSLQIKLTTQLLKQNSVSRELEQFMLQNRVTPRQRFKVVTCVLEAISNVLTHASPPQDSLILLLHCDRQSVVIDLLYDSPLSELPSPATCPTPQSLSGRGLWIINNWMDSVRYQDSVAGTHLRLCLLRR